MNQESFTSIFIKLKERLKSISRRYLEDDDEVDDALQDLFVKLWGKRDEMKTESQATGVMVTALKNICIDNLRHTSAHPKAELTEITDSPYDSHEVSELTDEINNIIAETLTERQRQILYERDRDGWEYEEIAARHGLSETNVRTILCRARKIVRDIYTTRYETHR